MDTLEIKKAERSIEFITEKQIEDFEIQKKCYIAELVKKTLDKYLDFDDFSADNTLSLYKLPVINEENDIIDFEINGLDVHVIPTVGKDKNENVYIPKSYKNYRYTPDMFIFVNFSKNFTKMEIVGFLTDINIEKKVINKSKLQSANNLVEALSSTKTHQIIHEDIPFETINEMTVSYIDGLLSKDDCRSLINYLLTNKTARQNYKVLYSMHYRFVCLAKNNKNISQEIFIPGNSENEYELSEKAISSEEAETENAISATASTAVFTADIKNEHSDAIEDEAEIKISENILKQEDELSDADNLEEFAQMLIDSQTQNNVSQISDFQPEFSEPEVSVETDEIATIEQEQIEPEVSIENDEIAAIEQEQIEPEVSIENDEIAAIEQEQIKPEVSAETDEIASLETEAYSDISLPLEEEDTIQLEEFEDSPLDLLDDENADLDVLQPIGEEFQQDINNSDYLELEDIPLDEFEENNDEQQQNENITSYYEQKVTEEEIAQSEDDELFSMLSEVSENENTAAETNNIIVEQELTENNIAENIQEPVISEAEQLTTNIQNDDISSQTATEENINLPENTEKAAAYDYQNDYKQSPSNVQLAKSRKILFGASALVVILAIGGFCCKDAIISLYGGSANQSAEADIPKPVDTGILPAAKSDSDIAQVPPSPVLPQKTATTNKNGIPDADSAPTLPNVPTTAVDLPKANNMNDAIAHALTKDFSGVRISKVSWEISETLLKNEEVTSCLKLAGKSIKDSLAHDLMAATEPSINGSAKVAITYKKDGSVANVSIDSSSGSQQIDNIILNSVNNTLKIVHMPAININKPEFVAKLYISL